MHKANSFHMTDGLFLECVRAVANHFPDVALEDMPVIVAKNFYGDIISDLASELSGSLGFAGSRGVVIEHTSGLHCR